MPVHTHVSWLWLFLGPHTGIYAWNANHVHLIACRCWQFSEVHFGMAVTGFHSFHSDIKILVRHLESDNPPQWPFNWLSLCSFHHCCRFRQFHADTVWKVPKMIPWWDTFSNKALIHLLYLLETCSYSYYVKIKPVIVLQYLLTTHYTLNKSVIPIRLLSIFPGRRMDHFSLTSRHFPHIPPHSYSDCNSMLHDKQGWGRLF